MLRSGKTRLPALGVLTYFPSPRLTILGEELRPHKSPTKQPRQISLSVCHFSLTVLSVGECQQSLV